MPQLATLSAVIYTLIIFIITFIGKMITRKCLACIFIGMLAFFFRWPLVQCPSEVKCLLVRLSICSNRTLLKMNHDSPLSLYIKLNSRERISYVQVILFLLYIDVIYARNSIGRLELELLIRCTIKNTNFYGDEHFKTEWNCCYRRRGCILLVDLLKYYYKIIVAMIKISFHKRCDVKNLII